MDDSPSSTPVSTNGASRRKAKSATGSLLYLLNVSNPDRLSADSGWLFADILAPALCDEGADVVVSSPRPVSDARVRHELMTSPGSKYELRFGFDVPQATAAIARVRPQTVVVNQIENAPGVRAALLSANTDAVVAGYCHYVPFHCDATGRLCLDPAMSDRGLGAPTMLAFMAGVLACDRVLVHSAIAEKWIRRAAEELSVELGDRLRVVPPPADPRLEPDAGPAPECAEPVGIYNHRLYAHYGTDRFVEVARLLERHGVLGRPLRLRVTDMFGTRRAERTRLDASPTRYLAQLAAMPNVQIVSDQGDRSRYRALLASSAFGIAPFRPAITWSMSVVDCMAMGVPVIAPRLGWLAEFVDDSLIFDTAEQAVGLVDRLLNEPGFAAAASIAATKRTAHLTPEAVARDYLAAVLA